MFETSHIAEDGTCAGLARPPPRQAAAEGRGLESILATMPLMRRRIRSRQSLFRAGQPRQSLFYVHAGCFRTCVLSADGRERVTGFRFRGDLLGLEALGTATHACDAVALDVGEVWEIPCGQWREPVMELQQCITERLASEIRRDWTWMLAIGTLAADPRVATFLLDLSDRLAAMGFSPRYLRLRMSRADIGSFLGLQLETVTRALSRLQAQGLISVEGRQICIEDPLGLHAVLQRADRRH